MATFSSGTGGVEGADALDFDEATEHDSTDEDPGLSSRMVRTRYDPARDREHKRGQIALRLIWLLSGIVAAALLLASAHLLCWFAATKCADIPFSSAVDLVQLLLTPVVGLVGAVTGFYYAEREGQGLRS